MNSKCKDYKVGALDLSEKLLSVIGVEYFGDNNGDEIRKIGIGLSI